MPRGPGLDDTVKRSLLQALDEHGGLRAVSYDNRMLAVVCDKNTELFGSPNSATPRKRRRQCQNWVNSLRCMDDEKQDLTRARILSNNPMLVLSSSGMSSSTPTKKQPRRKVTAKKRTTSSVLQQPAPYLGPTLTTPIKPQTKKPPTTTSTMFSPSKAARGSVFDITSSTELAVDLNRPESHYPLKVFPFTNAPVNGNKHMMSGVDIKFNAHIMDISNNWVKASIGGEGNTKIKIELPLLDHVKLAEYDALITAMTSVGEYNEVIQDQEATVMMEILEDEERQNHSFFMDFGLELVTESMVADGTAGNAEDVDFFVVPLETKSKLGPKVFTTHRCEVVWRIGFANTLRKKTKSTKAKGKGSAKIADLIMGMSNMTF
jgi:hypothetical protein